MSFAAVVEFGSAVMGGFHSAMGKAEAEVGRLDARIGDLNTRVGKIDAWRAAKAATSAARMAYTQARDRAAALRAELAATATPTEDLRNRTEAATRALEQSRTAFRASGHQLRDLTTELNAAGIETHALRAHLDDLTRQSEAATRARTNLTTAMAVRTQRREAMASAHGHLMEAVSWIKTLEAPIKLAIDFDDSFSRVEKAVGGTKAQLDSLRQGILQVRSPMSKGDLTEIIADAGQAGIPREELLQFGTDASKVALVWKMTGRDAGSALSRLRTTFHLNQTDTMDLAGAYNVLSKEVGVSGADLVHVATHVGDTATRFGLSGRELGALGATFLGLDRPPKVAASAIDVMLNRLGSADRQGKKFQTALSEIGLDAESFKQKIKEGPQDALVEFLEKLKGSDDIHGVSSDLFGGDQANNVESLVGALDQYKHSLSSASSEEAKAKSIQDSYANMSQSTKEQFNALSNAINGLSINFGTTFLPILNRTVGILTDALGAVSSLAMAYPQLTSAITYGVGALMAYRVASAALRFSMLAVRAPFDDLTVMYRRIVARAADGSTATGRFSARIGQLVARARAVSFGRVVGGLRSLRRTMITVPFHAFRRGLASIRGGTFFGAMAGSMRGLGGAMLGLVRGPFRAVRGGLRALRVAALTNPITLLSTILGIAAELVIENWDAVMRFIQPAIDWAMGAMDGVLRVWDRLFGDDDDDAGEKGTSAKKAPLAAPLPATARPEIKSFDPAALPARPARLALPANDNRLGGVSVDMPGKDDGSGPWSMDTVDGRSPGVSDGSGGSVTNRYTITMTVNAAPGQSEDEIARQVLGLLQSRERAASSGGGALYDEE